MKRTLIKVVALAACAVLLVAGSIAGTLAYLTSKTAPITNTFTAGSVEITLDEAKVDVYGTKEGDTRVAANAYKLIPGHTYVKDPTVHVTEGSEPCYLFVKVENGIAAIETGTTIAAQLTANEWTIVEGETDVYSHAVVDAGEGAVDVTVFESFTLKTDADVSTYNGETVVVTAYAVQADGFNTAKAAWDAAKSGFNS